MGKDLGTVIRRYVYKIHAPGADTNEIALACAAITVPIMMIVEMIAPNTKPAVFMLVSPLSEYESELIEVTLTI